MNNALIVAKAPYAEISLKAGTLLHERVYRAYNPVGRGNLLQNPESPSSYRIGGGMLTVAAAGAVALSAAMRAELGAWTKITGVDDKPTGGSASFQQVSIELPRDRQTYLTGLMLSEGPIAAFSPRRHIAIDDDVELVRPGDGLILSSPGGNRYRISINDRGQIGIVPLS